MIYKDLKLTVMGNNSKIDSDIYVYRNDRNIDFNFEVEIFNPYKYVDNQNMIESTSAAYSQIVIMKQKETPVFGKLQVVSDNVAKLTITDDMIDELNELGDYDFFIRLYDRTRESAVTIPPVIGQLHVLEPMGVGAEELTVYDEVGKAMINEMGLTYQAGEEPAFNGYGIYNKTIWKDRDIISKNKMNKIEEAMYKHSEQFISIEQNIYEKANSTTFAGKVRKQKKAIVTFIDDDGLSQKQIPLFQTRNMKCCLALTKKFLEESKIKTQYMTIEKALELQNNYGWEICTHGENHLELDKLSEQEVDNEILNCYNYLTKNGFKVNAHVYAYGYSTEYSRNVTRKNHIVGINATPNLQKPINNIPISTFRLGRVPLGWGTETGKDTLEYYKSLVDKCIDENGWLVFMCHLAMTSDEQITIIGQLLDYIQTRINDISVQTVTEAIKTFGNQIDIGDFEKFDDKDNSYHIVSADGKIYNSSSKYFTMHHSIIKKETPISEFPYGVTTVGFSSVDNTNFHSGGHIMTYRGRIYVDDLSFQMYFRYDTKGVEIRYWNDTTKKWGEFQTISGGGSSNTVVKSYNSATPTTPLQDFENGKITIVPITSSFASSNGFPTSLGGVLIVDRLVNDISFNTSEYKSVIGNTFIYRRLATSSTTWGAFNKIDSTKFTYLQDVVVGDIGTNGTKDVKVTVDGVRDGDLLFVYPQWTLEPGITFNFWVSANNEITIRLSNNFSSIVNVATRKWNLGYVKVK